MAQAIVENNASDDEEYDEEYEYYYEDADEVENDAQLETEEPLNNDDIQETNLDQYAYYEEPEISKDDEYAKHAANTSTVATNNTVVNAGERDDFTNILHQKDKDKKTTIQFNLISCVALFISILSLIILGIGLMMGLKNGALNAGSTSADASRRNNIIIKKHITNHYITNNISLKPSYNFTFEEADIGPYQGYNDTNPQIIYPGGMWYGWQFVESRTIQGQAARGNIAGTDDVNLPLADIHISYGDILIFFMAEDNRNDDLILVTKDIFDSCNFSSIANEDDDVTENSTDLWLTNKYGLYNHNNESDWEPYVFDIINRRNDPINSIKDELLAADILYFTSSYRWERDDKADSQSCKNGWKVRVIIDGYRNKTLDIISSNLNGIVDSKEVFDLQAGIGHISRMLILQQFHIENRIRSEGDSGITQTRGNYDGASDYDSGSYTNGNVLSIHNHANNEKVVGIGELSAVLNGIEFKTRHNDYNLNMPHSTSEDYHSTQSIPYPEIPREVLSKNTVSEQIIEMQEWFRAFKYQNTSHRNYTLYFKPILCYLEGTWITDDDSLSEPFASDRHYIDAKTWKELHDKVRWMANSGRKDTNENYATLPSSIRNLVNDTYPIISNWEYRILCSPLKNDIETSRFRIVNDLSVQLMGTPETRIELKYSRRARFELNKNLDSTEWEKGRMRWNYLDYLMEQIPGKNNYAVNLTDKLPDDTLATYHINDKTEIINSGYYSRFYSLSDNDAMGSSNHRRGYSDRYLFAAQTTHTKVSPIILEYGGYKSESRWSYAIPIEIIYMTPLSKWNPYSIPYQSDSDLWQERSGKCGEQPSEAWIEMKNSIYYNTPSLFFEGNHNEDNADTAIKGACAISGDDGNEYSVEASGHWIVFPAIGGDVGYVRQRYPIFPIHHSGSPAFKEVKALEDTILPPNYDDVEHGIAFWTDNRDLQFGFNLYLEGGGHDHMIFIKGKNIRKYWLNETNNEYYDDINGEQYMIEADSDIANGHTHTVKMYRYRDPIHGSWIYNILQCRFGLKNEDDMGYIYQNNSCADFHDTLRRDTS